ncbi:glycosyltransferase family 2 protein [Flavobacterium eburneipallidum]|uniref:glycosyltransferase family 2 protein n=1 Tax=Flavobacterium eburneipallidum TaxID=3003263 RepID=UPI0024830105|nr:glycosyltransferase family 2 protein [Flavobacterium eburneipallidum]
MINFKSIAVLLTCHNRSEKTVTCLTNLYKCIIPENYVLEIFLVDDGSTDGTAEKIKTQFPAVTIIQGDGNLFWNRGMYLAWQTAANTKDFDYYLWLNDDTFLFEKAIVSILNQNDVKAIVCGTTQSVENGKITYGGFKKNPDRLVQPNGSFQECDYCNGNFVLIPKEVFEIVGNLDPIFHHAVGDFDYSLRAKKMGVNVFVAPDYIGYCEAHSSVPKWQSTSVSVSTRLKSLYSATSGCYPPEFFVFDRRHNGFFVACFHYFTIHLRAIVPSLWNFKSN